MLKTGPILQIQIFLRTLSTIQMGKLFDAEMASNLAPQPVSILSLKYVEGTVLQGRAVKCSAPHYTAVQRGKLKFS